MDSIRLQVALCGEATHNDWTIKWDYYGPDEDHIGGYQSYVGQWTATKEGENGYYMMIKWSNYSNRESAKSRALVKLLNAMEVSNGRGPGGISGTCDAFS
jgi:hypothetical protein